MAMEITEVDVDLKAALDLRVNAMKNPSGNLSWTTGRLPWMKFTSNVLRAKLKEPRGAYPELHGGGASLGDLYDRSSKGRNQPQPGLTSATIKHTGTLKTIKKVQVSYTCHTLAQLYELEILFMSLGKTVVLEYGWSIKQDGTKVSGIMSEEDCKLGFSDFLVKAKELTKEHDGCYGAEKGVVSDFSWEQDSNGAYNCTTTFSAPSEMMMSHDTKKVNDGQCCEDLEQDDGTPCKQGTAVSRRLDQILKSSEVIPAGEARHLLALKNRPWGFAMTMDMEPNEEEKESKPWYKPSWLLGGSYDITQKFVTWAWFEEMIVNDAILAKSANSNTHKTATSATDKQAPASFRDTAITSAYRMDTRNTKLYNPEYMTSSNPLICMLPGQPFWMLMKNETFSETPGKWQTEVEDFDDMEGLYEMFPFRADRYRIGEGSIIKSSDENDKNLGWLSHICLNVRFIKACALETELLEEFIAKILDGINESCGNIWDLTVTPMIDEPALLTIIDASAVGDLDLAKAYPLKIFGNHSICKEATVNTEVSNEVKAQIMYGSNSGDGEFGLFAEGLTDATPDWNNLNTNQTYHCTTNADGTKVGKAKELYADVEFAQIKESYEDAWQALTEGVDSDNIETMKSTIKALRLFSPYEKVISTSPAVLPINFSFTTDGIVGFSWGHALKIDPLPPRYELRDCIFMVTGIDHSISADAWDTSVSTMLRLPPMDPEERGPLRENKPPPIENYDTRISRRYGSSGTTCFVAGTKVTMADKTHKPIEDVREGDKILSYNISTKEFGVDVVLPLPQILGSYKKIIALYEDGTRNEFSPAHPFYIEGKGWASYDLTDKIISTGDCGDGRLENEWNAMFEEGNLHQLEVGDYCMNSEGKKLQIKSLDETNEYVDMYNLEHLDNNKTWFANEVLVKE